MPPGLAHRQTILHLVPSNDRARDALNDPQNTPYVSYCRNGQLGLEIGYHVAIRPCPEKLVEIGRDADLVLPAASISAVQFSFEVHPESKCIMFYDRSRHYTTKIQPGGFRADGLFRQVVIHPGTSNPYEIGAGGSKRDLYQFTIVWLHPDNMAKEIERGYLQAAERPPRPRLARTVDDTATELPTWYNTRLQTPRGGGVERFQLCNSRLGEGAQGQVERAIDLDSGILIAVKVLKSSTEASQDFINREAKTLSQLSHKNIVEYLGCEGWNTPVIHIFTPIKQGNAATLFCANPVLRTCPKTLPLLLHQMLEALDYLSFRGYIHRDVKPENILYTQGGDGYLFQLADFGLSNRTGGDTFCGTGMFMAPELFDGTPQTPKMDVWSLFISILVLMRARGFDQVRNRHHVLQLARQAKKDHSQLASMGEEDVALRASAGQLLVKLFNGQGLTTPRAQIPIMTEPEPPKAINPIPKANTGLNQHRVQKKAVRIDKDRQRQDRPTNRQRVNHEILRMYPLGFS